MIFRRLKSFGRTSLAVMVLVGAILPLVALFPPISKQYSTYARHFLHRGVIDAPQVTLDKALIARARSFPSFSDAVPVLQYHGVGEHDDRYTVSQAQFASHMKLLRLAGFTSISIEQFVSFMRGDGRLPQKPILITFDDGRLDSYRGAHDVLDRLGMQAVMYAIVGAADHPFYLNWDELRELQASKHWDVQAHAGEGHHLIEVDASGERGPFYANLMYRSESGIESLADYTRRVVTDIMWGQDRLDEELPAFSPLSFSVPYGNLGDDGSNDPRIAGLFGSFLQRRFDAVFGSNEVAFNHPRDRDGVLTRIEIFQDTDVAGLLDLLRSAYDKRYGEEAMTTVAALKR